LLAKTGVTVELKDNKGNVVEVVAQDLAKGATSAQFDFKTEYKGDLEGVWSIGDAKFSFDELKQIAAISEAADEIKLEAALEAAGIENVNEDLIAEYFDALHGEEFASLADVQKAVDEVNKENEEVTNEEAVVKAVVDATSQKALLTALAANFDRVNADWIKDYADEELADKTSAQSTLLDLTKETAPTGFDKAAIQALVDAVNTDKIDAANTAAKTETTQKEVTALIQKWVKADEGKATAKKDAVAQSSAFELAFKVAESTNKGSLYNNLIKYANEVKGAGFKASDVLNVNQAAYLTVLTANDNTVKNNIIAAVATDKTSGSTTATIVKGIVTVVNGTELTNSILALYTAESGTSGQPGYVAEAGAAVAYDATKADTVKAFKESLEDIAAKSANLTGTDKFDISKVDSTKLEAYAAQIVTNAVTSVSELNTAIATVNSGDVLEAAVKVVNDADSTPEEVRAALTRLVSDVTPTVTNADKYLNLSAASKLDVAQLVIDNRPENGYVASTSSVEKVIAEAAVAQTTELKDILLSFEDIKLDSSTELAEFDFTTVNNLLADVPGTDYEELTDKVVQLDAARNFFDAIEVTEKDVNGTTTYTQAKFKTLVELKAAINAAVKAAQ